MVEEYIISEREELAKKNKTILIVDDSALIVSKMTELLEDMQVLNDVHYCNCYDGVIELLDTVRPDIALLDINLPGKSGIQLLKYLKHYYPGTIVIMFTNHASDHYKNLCISSGAEFFIDKSKDFERIPSIISSYA